MRPALTAAIVALMVTACGNDDSHSSEPDYAAAILTQDGFDFSLGAVPAVQTESDGDTVAWAPSPNIVVGGGTAELWFRATANDAQTSFTRDMGDVLLSTIRDAPTAWDGGTGQMLAPLKKNHSYVVKCLDGFAKFQIRSIDSGVTGWPVVVEYDFSAVSTFDR